jgi:hypothetical protein
VVAAGMSQKCFVITAMCLYLMLQQLLSAVQARRKPKIAKGARDIMPEQMIIRQKGAECANLEPQCQCDPLRFTVSNCHKE